MLYQHLLVRNDNERKINYDWPKYVLNIGASYGRRMCVSLKMIFSSLEWEYVVFW